MKFKVNKSTIEGAAILLSKVINSKNPLPILGDILCEVSENVMHMTGGDGECSITMCIGLLDLEGEDSFCIDGGRLLAALKQIPDQLITITCTTESDHMFTIEHEDGQMHFMAEEAGDYPVDAEEKWYDPDGFELRSDRIGEAVKRCLWAACTDENRPIMNGVHFATVKKYNALDIVASNGHTLVRTRLTEWNSHQFDGTMDATIPTKIAKIMADTLTDDEPVWIRFSSHKCQVETDRYTMTFRLIEGTYPKYNSVIPAENPIEACVDSGNLAQSVKRTLPFANDASKLLQLHFEESWLTLIGDDFDFSTGARDQIDKISFNCSDPFTIGLKGSTLLKALSYIPNQGIRMKMSDPSRAVLLEPKEPWKDTEVTILLMPLLINE